MRHEFSLLKKLGIIGGMSWVSTQQYYRLINKKVNEVRGRQHSAPLIVSSVNFQDIVNAQTRGDWHTAGVILADCAKELESVGCGAFLIASNTMHKVYEQTQKAVAMPGINIFDVTAKAINASGCKKIGLLGTRYTMQDPFFRDAYHARGIDVIVPEGNDAHALNEIIFKELIHEIVLPQSKLVCKGIVERLSKLGADAVILGCTEIEWVLKQEDVSVKIFDTTCLHATSAADWLLQTNSGT
jgi:aspartate racemase